MYMATWLHPSDTGFYGFLMQIQTGMAKDVSTHRPARAQPYGTARCGPIARSLNGNKSTPLIWNLPAGGKLAIPHLSGLCSCHSIARWALLELDRRKVSGPSGASTLSDHGGELTHVGTREARSIRKSGFVRIYFAAAAVRLAWAYIVRRSARSKRCSAPGSFLS